MTRHCVVVRAALPVTVAICLTSCGSPRPPAAALPPNTFAFGVFGDGPYQVWEEGRFKRLIEDVNRTDLSWLIHVGDVLWYPCSDDALQERLASLNSVHHPVIYTPGDNEWTDCHQRIAGSYEPLERLSSLRRIFFNEPGRSLGARSLALNSQAADPAFAEFVENARWTYGGFVFATLHLVGGDTFPGRTTAHDRELERRSAAAVEWLNQAFASAHEDSAKGVVLALHGNPAEDEAWLEPRRGYERVLESLKAQVAAFSGEVLFIHGDTHVQRVDQPLKYENGRVYKNFTRLETFGSPDIGWVRVVVDSVAGRFIQFEARLMPGWWW